MKPKIEHLFVCPEHCMEVAGWIHREWWLDKPGHSVATMAARLREAATRERIPLSLVALRDGRPIGTVNLVENDNDERTDLEPWLAALLVVPEFRNQGVGSALVRALQDEAAGLGIRRMYLGTDIPAYYKRLGARILASYPDDYRIMILESRREG